MHALAVHTIGSQGSQAYQRLPCIQHRKLATAQDKQDHNMRSQNEHSHSMQCMQRLEMLYSYINKPPNHLVAVPHGQSVTGTRYLETQPKWRAGRPHTPKP